MCFGVWLTSTNFPQYFGLSLCSLWLQIRLLYTQLKGTCIAFIWGIQAWSGTRGCIAINVVKLFTFSASYTTPIETLRAWKHMKAAGKLARVAQCGQDRWSWRGLFCDPHKWKHLQGHSVPRIRFSVRQPPSQLPAVSHFVDWPWQIWNEMPPPQRRKWNKVASRLEPVLICNLHHSQSHPDRCRCRGRCQSRGRVKSCWDKRGKKLI